MTLKQVALATENPHKRREFRELLNTAGIDLFDGLPLELPPETGRNYLHNALTKARYGAAKLGLPCLGEDSGIEIAGLNNLPGPFSARFCRFNPLEVNVAIQRGSLADLIPHKPVDGDPNALNNRLILERLKGMSADDHLARYVACLVLATPDGRILHVSHGVVDGRILQEPRGHNGFGHDPIIEFFEYPGRSAAELTPEEKNRVSHRGRAIRQLLEFLRITENIV